MILAGFTHEAAKELARRLRKWMPGEGNVVYVLPPYTMEPEELHRVYDVITKAVEALF